MEFPVLICDDSHLAQRMLRKALPEDFSCEVTMTDGGQQAIDCIRQRHFGVCFIDLVMPDVDGWQVLEFIHREKVETLCIVVTGDKQQETRRRAQQLGAVEVLTKPVSKADVCAVLQKYGIYSAQPNMACQ